MKRMLPAPPLSLSRRRPPNSIERTPMSASRATAPTIVTARVETRMS